MSCVYFKKIKNNRYNDKKWVKKITSESSSMSSKEGPGNVWTQRQWSDARRRERVARRRLAPPPYQPPHWLLVTVASRRNSPKILQFMSRRPIPGPSRSGGGVYPELSILFLPGQKIIRRRPFWLGPEYIVLQILLNDCAGASWAQSSLDHVAGIFHQGSAKAGKIETELLDGTQPEFKYLLLSQVFLGRPSTPIPIDWLPLAYITRGPCVNVDLASLYPVSDLSFPQTVTNDTNYVRLAHRMYRKFLTQI